MVIVIPKSKGNIKSPPVWTCKILVPVLADHTYPLADFADHVFRSGRKLEKEANVSRTPRKRPFKAKVPHIRDKYLTLYTQTA